jgi:hypothetical protein
MGKQRVDIERELPRFKTEANGFIIKFYGTFDIVLDAIKFSAKICRPGPTEFMVMELEEVNLPLLIMEAIEWTFYYKHGRDESNNRIDRYSQRTLPKLGRDGSSMDNILRRRLEYKRNSGEH